VQIYCQSPVAGN